MLSRFSEKFTRDLPTDEFFRVAVIMISHDVQLKTRYVASAGAGTLPPDFFFVSVPSHI
jgi:hypothetical protein